MYIAFLLGLTLTLVGINALQQLIVSQIHTSNIGQMDFSHPLVILRTVLGLGAGLFYLPMMLWVVLWIRRKYMSSVFTDQRMGVITLAFGIVMLIILQAPIQSLVHFSNALYGIAFCLILSGALCFALIRAWVYGLPLGTAAFVFALLWWALAWSELAIEEPSNAWLAIVFIASLTLTFGGILGGRARERWFAMLALLLITTYFFFGQRWVYVSTMFDSRFRTPLDFLGPLAWLTALGWLTGVWSKIGHPLGNGKEKGVSVGSRF